MVQFCTNPSAIFDWLRPFILDPRYHDVQVVCKDGDIITTSRLFFTAFLDDELVRQLEKISQETDELFVSIILPDCSSHDLRNLLFMGSSIEKDSQMGWESFCKTYFFCDKRKIGYQTKCIQEEEISQEKTHNENVENTFEDINGKSKLIRNNARKRIYESCKQFMEWSKDSKSGRCLVCFEEFQGNLKSLQRHVKNKHLGKSNLRKELQKLLAGESEKGLVNSESGVNMDDDFKQPTALGFKVGRTGRLYKQEQCSTCGKTLCSKYALKKHEDAVHLNIREFGCDICHKRFIMKNDLKDHVTTVHEKLKSCVCDVCGLKLATQHGLRVHKLIHEETSKSIRCDQCPKAFRHMCTYRRHVQRVHEFSQEKKLKCTSCDKLFNHQEGLSIHVKKFHSPQAAIYSCQICSQTFAFRYERTKHLRKLHKLDKQTALAMSNADQEIGLPT